MMRLFPAQSQTPHFVSPETPFVCKKVTKKIYFPAKHPRSCFRLYECSRVLKLFRDGKRLGRLPRGGSRGAFDTQSFRACEPGRRGAFAERLLFPCLRVNFPVQGSAAPADSPV